jgi:signal transduction histidine kinase
MGVHLERSLDSRLRTAAYLSTQIIQRDLGDLYDVTEYSLLRLTLTRIQNQNDLEAAYILDPSMNVIIDSRLDLELSISRSYLHEDSTEIESALEGSIITSRLHSLAGNDFKNVYSLITDLQGNSALLALEANAQFLSIIKTFRQSLYIGTLASILLLGMLIVFLVWATLLFLRTELKLQESERLAVMGQMAATVAHEIRNPLGIIKSAGDVLRERYDSKEKPEKLFGYIDDEIKRLNRIVNDFLSFAREPEMNISRHNLAELLQDIITSFRSDQLKNLDISFQNHAGELFIQCDSDMIRQVQLNVLLNAAQAIEQTNGMIRVSLFLKKMRGKPLALVQTVDNGNGIQTDPEEIFNPFYTTKAKGSGLGLAVCRSIVRRHNGKIWAEQEKEGGTAIYYSLPLEK